MAKKTPKSTSSSILDSLDEAKKPDHLLSNDSPEKKKRAWQRMLNDAMEAAMLYAIRIQSAFIKGLDDRRRANEIERAERSREGRNMSLPPLGREIIKSHLINHEELKIIKEKFDFIINKLESKINAITKDINSKREEVGNLRFKAIQSRKELADRWIDHFQQLSADPDFHQVKLRLPLREMLRDHPQAENVSDYIELPKEVYLQMAREIGENLMNGQLSIQDVDDFIQSRAESLIGTHLDKHLAFMSSEERVNFVNGIGHEELVKGIRELFLGQILRNKELTQLVKTSYENEFVHSAAAMDLSTRERYAAGLIELSLSLKRESPYIEKMLTQPMTNKAPVSRRESDAVDKLNRFLDLCSEKVDSMEHELKHQQEEHQRSVRKMKGLLNLINQFEEGVKKSSNSSTEGYRTELSSIEQQVKEFLELMRKDKVHDRKEDHRPSYSPSFK